MVVLLVQDKLVMDLRNTIRQLQVENRTLAGSLQQLSTGADLVQVIESLPERLRPMPSTAPQQSTTALGGVGPLSSSLTPGPLAHGVTAGVGAGLPWKAAGDHLLPPTPKSANVLRLRPMQETGGGPGRQASSLRSSSVTEYTAGAAGVRASVGHVPRARVKRPSLEGPQPFNLSSVYTPSPPRPLPGRTSPTRRRFANMSGSAQKPQAWGAASMPSGPLGGQALGIPPHSLMLDPVAFPELAALEAQFMETMAAGGGDGFSSPPSSSSCQQQQQQQQRSGGRAHDASVASPSRGEAEGAEDQAVKWARKNRWFGIDSEMTEYAYKVWHPFGHPWAAELPGLALPCLQVPVLPFKQTI